MESLSLDLLQDILKKAVQLNLSQDFIQIIENAINERVVGEYMKSPLIINFEY